MKNLEISKLLYEIADILEMQNVQWKPAAYRKAARSIEGLSKDIEVIYKKKGLKGLNEIPGVGEGIAKKIAEYLEKGKISELERLEKKIPKGLVDIINVQGVGPKKAWKLYKKLGINTLAKLERAAKQGKIRKLPGFGEKSEEDILTGISLLKRGHERMLLGRALPIAESILKKLKSLRHVKRGDIAGSIRRRKETVKDIDILVVSNNAKEVMDYFTSMEEVKLVLAKGSTKSSVVLKAGLNSDLRIVPEKSYGAALNYLTGSKDHNVHLRQIALKKGYTLSEYGLFRLKGHKYVAGKTEEEVYKKLGMGYIEPELRENRGEIEAALKNKLPKLVPYGSLKGDLHVHTKWTDGVNTTEEMIKAAISMGYEYLAITDHSKSTYVANGLTESQVSKRLRELEKLEKKYRNIHILKASEVDILANGDLDYSTKTLKKFDFVVAAVHSRFKAKKEEMTKRIIKAIENKYVNVIAHPSGRLINEREPYNVNMDKVFRAAKENGVALEINAHPNRLDLNDVYIKKAVEYGLKLVISTDAHSVEHLRYAELGIAQARRGWARKKDILNTLSFKKFEKMIRRN
jgi:DNA polymerase (family 10)